MLPYEHVKSIHDQKMAQFLAERDKDQMARMVKAGRPGMIQRFTEALGEAVKTAGTALVERRGGPAQAA